MAPLIKSGDTIEVIYRPISKIRIGDIILFENHNKNLTAHRVFIKGVSTIITKGDFSKDFHDIIVTKENYLGLVIKLHKQNNIKLNYKSIRAYFFLGIPAIKKIVIIKNILRK